MMPGHERVHITASASLPTRHGAFQMESFRWEPGLEPHLALSLGLHRGDVVPLVRIHSECITGDAFGSVRCDCGGQLEEAMRIIGRAGCGVVIYLRQEGRGIGIEKKLLAYELQEQGLDTVDANLALGLPVDSRSYDAAVGYLRHRGIYRCKLLTDNPRKLLALHENHIAAVRARLMTPDREACKHYLETKHLRMGHYR
jgi:GTP cyclohydrolase II